MNRREFISLCAGSSVGAIAGCNTESAVTNPLTGIRTINRTSKSLDIKLKISSVVSDRSYTYSETVAPIDDRAEYIVEPGIDNVYDFDYRILIKSTNSEEVVSSDFLRRKYRNDAKKKRPMHVV
jgi:hypothetical protein